MLIIINTLMPSFLNFLACLIGRCAASLIHGEDESVNIVFIVLGAAISILLCSFQSRYVSTCIMFRPQAVHLLYYFESLQFHFAVLVFEILVPIGAGLDGVAGVLVEYCSIIFLLLALRVAYRSHSWAYTPFQQKVFSALVICVVLCLVSPLLRALGVAGSEIQILIVAIGAGLLWYLTSSGFTDPSLANQAMLDAFVTDPAGAEEISYLQTLKLLQWGFDHGHPYCHSWALFNSAIARFPHDRVLTVMYLRYAAIYPEETAVLEVATDNARTRSAEGSVTKMYLHRVRSIMQRRERLFSKSLRASIQRVNEKTEKCRSQIRYILECVIQQRIGELERVVRALKANELSILSEFNQLCLVYPNNPYVASTFAAFLSDILCRKHDAEEYGAIYKALKSGATTGIESTYLYARMCIPGLPTIERHSAMSSPEAKPALARQNSMTSMTSQQVTLAPTIAVSEAAARHRQLEELVDGAKLPVMRYGPPILVFSVALLLPIISLVLMGVSLARLSNNSTLMEVNEPVAMVGLGLTHVPLAVFQMVMSNISRTPPLAAKFAALKQNSDTAWGVAPVGTDEEEISRYVEELLGPLELTTLTFHGVSTIDDFRDAMLRYLTPTHEIVEWLSPTEKAPRLRSLEQTLTFLTSISVKLINKQGYDILNDSQFWTVIKNADVSFKEVMSFSRLVRNSLRSVVNHTGGQILIYVNILWSVAVALALLSYLFVTYQFSVQKAFVFDSFQSLGKATISEIVKKLNEQSGKRQNDTAQPVLNPAEENALRVLSTPVAGDDTEFSMAVVAGNGLILMVLYVLLATVIIVMFHVIIGRTFNMMEAIAPFYIALPESHGQFGVSLLYLMRAAALQIPEVAGPSNDTMLALLDAASLLLNETYATMRKLRFGTWRQEGLQLKTVWGKLGDMVGQVDYDVNKLWEHHHPMAALSGLSFDNTVTLIYDMLATIERNLRYNLTTVSISDSHFVMPLLWILELSSKRVLKPAIEYLTVYLHGELEMWTTYGLIVPITVCSILIILIGLGLVPGFLSRGQDVHWILHVLLFCDPMIVLQSKQFFKILSNDSGGFADEDLEEASHLYEMICAASPNPLLFLDNSLVVHSVNEAAVQAIGLPADEIIGQPLLEVLRPTNATALDTFVRAVKEASSGLRVPVIECDLVLNTPLGVRDYHAKIVAVNSYGEIERSATLSTRVALFTLRLTDFAQVETLRVTLRQQREKVHDLLASALPRRFSSADSNRRREFTTLCHLPCLCTWRYIRRRADSSRASQPHSRLCSRHLTNSLQIRPR
jgi:PAS domain-containing protein